jgi:polysaccharide pyruvyl transferase WcaK-like protein/glycosyltransferase involved in cell wall biosynthesis
VHSAKAGGAERMALAEAAHLAPAHDLVISVPGGPLRADFAAHGTLVDGTTSAPLWGAPAWRWAGRCGRILVQAARLARTIRQRDVDVVLTNSSVSVAPVLAARLAGVPAIVHVRDVPTSRLARLVFKLHQALAHTVIVISDGLESYFRGSWGARVVHIPEGVEIRERGEPVREADLRPAGARLRLCLVGGVDPRKGQDIAVEAVASLAQDGVDLELDVVGREIDPDFSEHVRRLAGRLGVSDRVHFLGELGDVREHLRAVDVVVSPSRGEWTPLSIMEAMAERKPVIAADVGSVSEVVTHGVTGILIPPEDPGRLAAAIAELASDPPRMSALAAAGRRSVETSFDIAGTLASLDGEIRRAVTAPPEPKPEPTRGKRPVRPAHRRLKISFFGHFGSPNPGNESTLLAILSYLRAHSPDGDFRCICTYPEVVSARDGIQAIPITTREIKGWDRNLPFVTRLPKAFVAAAAELGQYVRAFRELKGTDMLIVPGTGLVNDAFGLSGWGPYGMFKWTVMAKLRGCKVLFVSVGAGPLDSARGRILAKAALSLADYRSYRDDASRDYLRRIGFRADQDSVYPDLVFNLPKELLTRDRAGGARPVVGLGLMVYPGKYSAADPRPETYTAYLHSLAAFAIWLLEHGYDIRLLLGDADTMAIDAFKSVLQTRFGSYDVERVVDQPIRSVDDVLGEIAATDIVVATRFHNVLLSLLLNKPVIAISFHHKCSSLMRQMDLSEYCHEIHDIDTDRLIAQFQRLEENQTAVKQTIDQAVDQARVALDEQYELLLAT